ncbi:MAG: hypothetical protein EA401_00620 [Planctomycetota bacterium]|nr:MAG: hypothetical protein EA401_00620 [Planctomycetota bacterium]
MVFPEAASETKGYTDWRSWTFETTPWTDFLRELAATTGHSFVTGTIERINDIPRNGVRLVAAATNTLLHYKTVADLPDEAFVAADTGAILDTNPTIHRGIAIASVLCVEYNETVWVTLQDRLHASECANTPQVIAIPASLSREIVTTKSPLGWPLLMQPVVLANSHPNGLESFVASQSGMWVRQSDNAQLCVKVAPLAKLLNS